MATRSLSVTPPFSLSHVSARAWVPQESRRSPSRREEKEAVCEVPWPATPLTLLFSCLSPEAARTLLDSFCRQENEGSERPHGWPPSSAGRRPGVTPGPDARPPPWLDPSLTPRLCWDICVSTGGVCAQLRHGGVTVGVAVTGARLTRTLGCRWCSASPHPGRGHPPTWVPGELATPPAGLWPPLPTLACASGPAEAPLGLSRDPGPSQPTGSHGTLLYTFQLEVGTGRAVTRTRPPFQRARVPLPTNLFPFLLSQRLRPQIPSVCSLPSPLAYGHRLQAWGLLC